MQNDQPLVAYALPDAVDRLFVTFGVWKTLKTVVFAAVVPRAPPTDPAGQTDPAASARASALKAGGDTVIRIGFAVIGALIVLGLLLWARQLNRRR